MAHSFDIASVSSAKVRQIHAHWEQVRGARLMPARADIDPSAIKPLLSNIVIAEVFHDPLRVRYRWSAPPWWSIRASTTPASGCTRWISGTAGLDLPSTKCSWEKRPLFGHSEILFEDNVRPPQRYEFCMLPLSADGATVTGMLARGHGALGAGPRAGGRCAPPRAATRRRRFAVPTGMSWPMVTASAVFGVAATRSKVVSPLVSTRTSTVDPLSVMLTCPYWAASISIGAATAGAGDEGSSACKSRARMDLTRGSAAIFRP
jgi:hypothetical protein